RSLVRATILVDAHREGELEAAPRAAVGTHNARLDARLARLAASTTPRARAKLDAARLELRVEPLRVGDVHVLVGGALRVCVERKTLGDLSNSIASGHLASQEVSMLELQRGAGVQCYLALERSAAAARQLADANYEGFVAGARLPAPALRGKLNSLSLRRGIPVLPA